MTKATPINSHAALSLEYVDKGGERKKILVISDLHLGSETELIKKGINIDSHSVSRDLLKEIDELKAVHSFNGIIILGDLKALSYILQKMNGKQYLFFLKSYL